MSIVEGAVGGLIAALTTLLITEYLRSRSERQTAVTGLATELTHNLSVACDVLTWNVEIFDANAQSDPWWELVAFSKASWTAVMSGGLLPRLRPGPVEKIAQSYSELGKADYSAQKLLFGKVRWRKSVEYTIRVFEAGEAVSTALQAMKDDRRYQRLLQGNTQLDGVLSTWRQEVRRWRSEVDQMRKRLRSGER